MSEPIGLEVLLTPRKKVVANMPNEKLDVLLRLRAHDVNNQEWKRTPLAISIVIDQSGSMSGEKLEEAKNAAIDLVQRLDDDDLVSVVSYDDDVQIAIELTQVSFVKTFFKSKIQYIRSGGSTNLHGGWLKGAEMLAPKANDKYLCRVILLSDGQANRGITNVDRICEQVSELANAGITTTTVGFGLDFNEELMTAIANAGQGNAWFGERVEDLMESFDSEFGFLSKLAFKEVEIHVHYAGHRLQMRNDYLSTSQNTWKFTGIPVGSEKWLAFSMPMREVIEIQELRNTIMEVEILLKDNEGKQHRVTRTLSPLEVVSPAMYRDAVEDELVARRFQEVEIADIQREARAWALDGDYERVQQMITTLEVRARNNPWLLDTVRNLQKLLNNREMRRMEKELMFSSRAMKNRVTELEEQLLYDAREELSKEAFFRKKVFQGRNSGSQE